MSLETRLKDYILAAGTDYKQFRTWITGSSTGDLSTLTTTAKGSLLQAINEVNARAAGAPSSATESTAGVAPIATQTETTTGTEDGKIVTPLKLQQKLTAWAQPLNANLTNIANLASQTNYGRAFLTLANQSGLMALLAPASDTVAGISRNATQTETNTGTNDSAAVTPLKLQTRLTAYALPLSYLDTDGSMSSNSDTKVPTVKAARAYADALLDANNAYVYKGGIDASTNPNYPAGNAGHTYKITAAGRVGGAGGDVVEAGDSITLLVDGSAAGTKASVGSNWLITQTNIDGAVVGPASSVASNIAVFSGTTGKVVADSGLSVETDTALSSNANTKLPSSLAVKTYVGNYAYSKTAVGDTEADLAAYYTSAKA